MSALKYFTCRICGERFRGKGPSIMLKHIRKAHPKQWAITSKNYGKHKRRIIKDNQAIVAAGHLSKETQSATLTNEAEGLASEFVAFTWGGLRKEIEAFSEQYGVPQPLITSRLARLFQRASNRQILGSVYPVSSLRGKATD